jgi:hypothetical protein
VIGHHHLSTNGRKEHQCDNVDRAVSRLLYNANPLSSQIDWSQIAPQAQRIIIRLVTDKSALNAHLMRVDEAQKRAVASSDSVTTRLVADACAQPEDLKSTPRVAQIQGSDLELFCGRLLQANEELLNDGPYGPICSTGVPLMYLLRSDGVLAGFRIQVLARNSPFWKNAFQGRREVFVPGDRDDRVAGSLLCLADTLPKIL